MMKHKKRRCMCIYGITLFLTNHLQVPFAMPCAQNPAFPWCRGVPMTVLHHRVRGAQQHLPPERGPHFPFKPAWPERSQQCPKQQEQPRRPLMSFHAHVTSLYEHCKGQGQATPKCTAVTYGLLWINTTAGAREILWPSLKPGNTSLMGKVPSLHLEGRRRPYSRRQGIRSPEDCINTSCYIFT